MDKVIIRFCDVVISILALSLLSPLILILLFLGLVKFGSPIFRQERLGRNKCTFVIYKFRTMPLNTPSISTHLVGANQIDGFGRVLRSSKLDELPQLLNVISGDMSLVGPRPNLVSQMDVIQERSKLDVFNVRPGITGASQLKKIDMSTPAELAASDKHMIDNFSLFTYIQILVKTLIGKGRGDILAK